MQFYDMIKGFDEENVDINIEKIADNIFYEFINEMPLEIREIIKNIKFQQIDNNYVFSLDYIWSLCKNICKKYTDTEWIKNLETTEDTLFEDIKYHCILNIYLSIRNKNIKKISMRKCLYSYYGIEEHSINDDTEKVNNDYPNFTKKFDRWVDEFSNFNYIDMETDFAYCFNESIFAKLNSQKTKKLVITNLDPKIFYEVINNWNDCPYSNKNVKGLTFEELYKFYYHFEKYIKEPNSDIDKIIRAYTIERLFNISFINHLSKYLKDVHKKIPSKMEAETLLLLSEIVSIPMVFSRNKYINLIHEKFDYKNLLSCQIKLKSSIYYLTSYLMPLLLRVYYCLIFLYSKNTNIGNRCMCDLIEARLEKYINANREKYNYREAIIGDKHEFEKNIGNEPFQINITEIIYNYKYNRWAIDKNQDIFSIMKDFEEEVISQVSLSKYSRDIYWLNFPYNRIYSVYNDNKVNRKKE